MKKNILSLVILFLSGFCLWAQSNDIMANILILDVSEAQFNQQAEAAGWETGHLMFKGSNVTSSDDNFWRDVQIYSKNGVPLFSAMQQVKTRALSYGYLQLANYDRDSKEIEPLNTYPIFYDDLDIDLPENSPIYLNLTSEEFSSSVGLQWKTFHIMISSDSVTSINSSSSVPIYSKDKEFLFSVAYPAADYVRQMGKLTIANYMNRQVSELVKIDLIR